MAFTGAATFKTISDCKLRITGLSLAGGALGKFIYNGPGVTPEDTIKLPDLCSSWHSYVNGEAQEVLPVEAIECTIHPLAADANGVVEKIWMTKEGVAVDGSDFVLTLTNADAMNASPGLEIELSYHT